MKNFILRYVTLTLLSAFLLWNMLDNNMYIGVLLHFIIGIISNIMCIYAREIEDKLY